MAMSNSVIVPSGRAWSAYDTIADALASGTSVSLDVDGESLELSRELVDVLRQAAELLARDKAIEITPRARLRFV